MTQPRRAVVATLAGTREHLSAEEILVDASKAYPGVNRSTIYRALETLADLGVDPAQARQRVLDELRHASS